MSCAPATGRRAKTRSRRPEVSTLEGIREALPGYARDLQLNLGTVLTPAGAPGLSERQIWAVALAAAAASRNAAFSRDMQALAARHLDAAHVSAAHAAAAIMAMNNVYYRFLHLVEEAVVDVVHGHDGGGGVRRTHVRGVQMPRGQRLHITAEGGVARGGGGGQRHRPDLPLAEAGSARRGEYRAEVQLQIARVARQRLANALQSAHLRPP